MALQIHWLGIPWIIFALNPGPVFSVSTPMNTTVLVGESFALNCSTNKTDDKSFIDWSFFPDVHLNYSNYAQSCSNTRPSKETKCINIVASRRILPSQNGSYAVTIEANRTHYNSTLSAKSAISSYAGVYQCVDDFGSTAFSFLTLIDPHPNCSETVLSNNTYTVNCSFAYFGLAPQFQWNSVNSDELINCTQEGNNYVICFFKHSLTSHGRHNACRFEMADKRESNEIELANLSLRFSYRSLIFYLQCDVGDMFTTSSDPGGSTESKDSDISVIVSIAVIAGVVALAIFVVVLLLKCESRKRKAKSDTDMSSQTMVEDDEPGPVYAEANRNKSRSKTPIYAEVKSKAGKKTNNNSVPQQDPVIAETGIYGFASYEDDDANNGPARARKKSPHDGIIYSELQRLEPIGDGPKKGKTPLFQIREGFERSDYVSVDHSFQAPPAPPRTHR